MSTEISNEMTTKKREITLYCHFSFKRPKGSGYGLFAVAIYQDFEGKKLIAQKTRKLHLWQDHQFITAIQAYEHALYTIHEWQGMMKDVGVKQVMLVTDNSTLAGWIENPKKNKEYTGYMQRAVQNYKVGGPKEILLGIGLCEPRKAEKSYKFCTEDRVVNKYTTKKDTNKQTNYKLQIGNYVSAIDLVSNSISKPEMESIKEISANDLED